LPWASAIKIVQPLRLQQHKPAAGLFDDALAGQRGQLAGHHLALGRYAVGQLALQRRWRDDALAIIAHARARQAQQLGAQALLGGQESIFAETLVEVADTAGQHFQHRQVNRRNGTAGIAEDGIRHGADPGLLECRHVGRAGLAVDGGHFAEILPGGHVIEDDLAAGRRAQQDPHPTIDHEQDFCGLVLVINDQLVLGNRAPDAMHRQPPDISIRQTSEQRYVSQFIHVRNDVPLRQDFQPQLSHPARGVPAMCSSTHQHPPATPMVMVNNKDGPAKARSNKYTRLVAEVQALHRSGD
jgi:hypothetical protein